MHNTLSELAQALLNEVEAHEQTIERLTAENPQLANLVSHLRGEDHE